MGSRAPSFKTKTVSASPRPRAWWVARSGPPDVGPAGKAGASGICNATRGQQRDSVPGLGAAEPRTAPAAGTAGRPEGAAAEGRCLNLSLGRFRSTQAETHWRRDVKTLS